MAIKTRAAVMEGKNSPLIVKEITLEAPKEREVLVKLDLAGLCRSDLNAISGHTRYDMPLVLGHEGAGTVIETGPGVKTVRKGDKVVLSWAAYCGDCFFCKKGLVHQCHTIAWPRGRGFLPDWTTRFKDNGRDVFHFNGVSSFSEYTVVYETGCVRVDHGIPDAVSSIVGCSVMTGFGSVFNTADVAEGSACMVVGAGSVGMSVIQALRIKGAGMIILIEPDKGKWPAALNNGATHTFTEITVPEIKKLTGDFGADMAFDCVSTPETMKNCLTSVRRAGTVVIVGSPHPLSKVEFDAIEFHLEKKVIGSLYGSSDPQRDIPKVLDHYRKGSLNFQGFSNGAFRLDDINEALKTLDEKGGKYTITF